MIPIESLNMAGLVIVMFLAFAIPPLLSRLRKIRIPIAVGEILAGILVGTSGLRLVQMDPALEVLQFLGLLYLMFAAGLEVDFQSLSQGKQHEEGGEAARAGILQRLHNPVLFGVANNLIAVGLAAWWVSSFTDRSLLPHPLAFALLMGTVGFSIIMPVLKETKRLATPFGQMIIGVAAIGDFAPVIAITVLITLQRSGSVLDVVLLGVLFAAVYLAYRIGKGFRHGHLFQGLTSGTAQIDVRGASLLMFLFGLLAQSLRVEVLLGAFLAGLLVSMLVGRSRQELIEKMDTVGFGFLIPIFFIMVGVQFDVRVLLNNPAALAFVPLLLVVLILIKALPALLLRLWYPWRLTLAGSALLTSQMSVTVAFSAVLLENGMIGEEIHAAIILTAILTAILGPVLYSRILPKEPDPVERSGVLLVGAVRESILIARRMQETGERCTVIDTDPEKILAARSAGVEAVQADALDPQVLRELGAGTARVMVALTGRDDVNLGACRLAAEEFGVERTVAIVRSSANIEEAHWSGLEMINPGLATAALIEMMVTSPATAQLVAGNTEAHRLTDVVLENRSYAGKRLRDADLPAGIIIVSVLRRNERIIPHGDTVLQRGDVLTIAGSAQDLAECRLRLGGVRARR